MWRVMIPLPKFLEEFNNSNLWVRGGEAEAEEQEEWKG